MFTQVYFRAQEILGFLSGNKGCVDLQKVGRAGSDREQLLLRKRRGTGANNERPSSEVDSEELKL